VEWQTHANQPVQLKQWLGKRVVLSMFYTSCSSACPIILQKMKLIEKKLEAQGMKAEFIVISFDAATDDPAKLNHFRRHMEVDRDNWTFLVSSAENTRLMANLLGFRYRKNQDTGEIFHNNRILLIDESGQNIKVLEGLDAALDDLL
jgi:protein SCO1/2